MSELLKQNLNDGWEFQESGAHNWKNSKIPGCVHLDLLNNELIPEPFYGTNEIDLQWISDKDWNYKLIFEPKLGLLSQKKNTIEIQWAGHIRGCIFKWKKDIRDR